MHRRGEMVSRPNDWTRLLRSSRLVRALSLSRLGRAVITRGEALALSTWNALVLPRFFPVRGPVDPDVERILEWSKRRTDISDHLLTLYAEAIEMKPRVMVELGVRTGESTRVLLMAAERVRATLVSVDIDDCSTVACSPAWRFIRSDDVEFAKRWPSWAESNGLPQSIDFLFIDTSHLYEHAKAEIATWFPYLAPEAKVAFHDTNLRRWYRRRDGSLGQGWDNDRGVIRAIEDYLGTKFDETRPFAIVINGWLVRHDPICNGLTILRRIWATT